jgi:hypothetical protein
MSISPETGKVKELPSAARMLTIPSASSTAEIDLCGPVNHGKFA